MIACVVSKQYFDSSIVMLVEPVAKTSKVSKSATAPGTSSSNKTAEELDGDSAMCEESQEIELVIKPLPQVDRKVAICFL